MRNLVTVATWRQTLCSPVLCSYVLSCNDTFAVEKALLKDSELKWALRFLVCLSSETMVTCELNVAANELGNK